MRLYKLSIFLTFFLAVQSSFSFDFIDPLLKDFIERIVVPEYHKEFYDYYTAFIKNIDQLGKSNPTKKRNELSRVRNLALWSLENNHPDWALQIKPYLHAIAENNEQKGLIDTFLVRYGVLQEFMKHIAQEHASMWYRVKSYSKHLGSKMISFFTGFTERKETFTA